MDTRTFARAIVFIMWRVAQAVVIYPAVCIGLFLAAMTLAGERPVEALVEGVFHYADTNIRAATPGHVLVVDCLAPAETSGLTKPPVVCDSSAPREIGITEAVATTMNAMLQMYWSLVLISFFFLLVQIPDWRKLLGLTAPPEASDGKGVGDLPAD